MKVRFEKPGNMLNPTPVVMVGCGTPEKPNIITLAWAGTVCSDPPMVSVSVRKERFSHDLIEKSGVFTVNLVNRALLRACDYCGVKSGLDTDKFADCHLTPAYGDETGAPMIEESPVSMECRVTQMLELGSHDMFLGEIVSVYADEKYFDEHGAFHLEKTDLVAYSHGRYQPLGEILGTFGFSVRKRPKK